MPDNEGQVSEASSLENAGEPIQPDQAVAGAPDAESGEVQEGRTGPNARTGDETAENAAGAKRAQADTRS